MADATGGVSVVRRTVVERLRARALSFPENVAIIEGEYRASYGQMWDRVDRLSAGLAALGLRKGDAVLAFLGNVHEAVECELAALGSGLAWITLTSRLTWPEVRGVVASCAPKLVITSAEGAAKLDQGVRELPLDPMPEILVTGGAASEHGSYEALLAAHAPAPSPVVVGDDDVARLRYTSGTTGSAKAAVLPHRAYHAILDNLLAVLRPVTSRDRALHAAPLTHGSGSLMYPVFHEGGANVLVHSFDVEGVLAAIEERRITAMFTVPTMLSRLVSSPRFEEHDASSLRALIYGGAPMPEAQLREAVRKIGRALVHIYGMTEAPWPIATLGPEEHRLENPRLRAVGRAAPLCTLRIVDADGGPAPSGTVGEIQIRGENVMSGYFRDEEGTREVLRDGWLASGDLGTMDDDGVVTIVGRKKDVIISGGFNVYPAEVEAALSSHPGVLEAAVVGLPHDDWGELVAAYVVPRPGATLAPAELDAVARKLLSGYKCPRRIELVPELPKNASGKIQKSEILRSLSRTR